MRDVLTWLCFFVLYSFIGWVCETLYCSIGERRFINRGFLNGPFCPIYGFGALLVLSLFARYEHDLLALFVLSMVGTTIIEYLTSFLLEKLFHLSLWDYSEKKWQVNGRVCLLNSVLFGIMAVVIVRFIHPHLVSLLAACPQRALYVALSVMCLYFIADLTLTIRALAQILRQAGDRQMELDELARRRDQVRTDIADRRKARFRAKQEALYSRTGRLFQRRLLRAFPKIRSIRYPQAFSEIREHILKEWQKRAPWHKKG